MCCRERRCRAPVFDRRCDSLSPLDHAAPRQVQISQPRNADRSETATDFRDFRERTDELLSAVSQDQEGSGGRSWLHPCNIKDDLPAIEPRAHHGKPTIDEKSDQVCLAISMFISNAACGYHPPLLKISFDIARECERGHSYKLKHRARTLPCAR
jgi:hypothetical protein